MCFEIKEVLPQEKGWKGNIHIAMAPTKMMDRVEWFSEKATEVGIDEITFLNCKFSERKVMRTVRLDKIVVSAVKQSRKPWKPKLNAMMSFKDFVTAKRDGHKYIAHCMCKSVASNIGIDLLWPMITNAYGVGELSPRFLNTTLRKIIKGEPLRFTSATQNYDFVYVSDVAKAFYLVAKNGKPFYEYMIGSGDAKPLRQFILEMVNSCAPDSVLLFGDVPFTGTNMPLSVFDISDIKADCGFKPEISFAQGAKMTMDWLKTLE